MVFLPARIFSDINERNHKFCDKTIAHINSTENALKQNMEKEEFQEIKQTISGNEEATKRVLKQRKFKNFY